ncbi:phosphoglycolate phosphatase [Methanogenium organophilum]|uniref:Phosphoglycolate phosphatase n=1 Tax=Methanogenium organophilum TaxID=2199 RepID=A0A9X9S4H8_METOG|nr:phosphoglycolate phosphatase [Methanogenium organophilum]WAI01318.1 phosphoglycolate phosphatase [Methanogenium organophilum]
MNTSFSHTISAVITDLDGTLTDKRRRISTVAVECIRTLTDSGIPVILASGNTLCSMTILAKMIGTDGTVICENGGTYRIGFDGDECIIGDITACRNAFSVLQGYFKERGEVLQLYSPEYRFADVAFARTVDPDIVREVLSGTPVRVLDTGFAIHLQTEGITKGTAFLQICDAIGRKPDEFLAVGDSHNDIEMIQAAGYGAVVQNCSDDICQAADYVSGKKYGEGFVDAVQNVFPSLF